MDEWVSIIPPPAGWEWFHDQWAVCADWDRILFLLAAQAGGSGKHIAVAAVVLFLACSIGRAPAQRLGRAAEHSGTGGIRLICCSMGAASLYSCSRQLRGDGVFQDPGGAVCLRCGTLVRAKREDAPGWQP